MDEPDGRVIVADTGALIALALMGLLPSVALLLGQLWVPRAVVRECLRDKSKPAASLIDDALERGWLTPVAIEDSELLSDLESLLDAGEAQAIALARQRKIPILIDERQGRAVAKRHGLIAVGSLAVAIKAKQSRVVTKITPLIERLEQHGYYLSSALKQDVLKRSGE